jgi:hypothetical protein
MFWGVVSAIFGSDLGLAGTGWTPAASASVRRRYRWLEGLQLDTAERQQKHGHLISPRRGFYVIVPPQFMSWGAPPPSWYIDALMYHEGRPYYVGLLKAAELHGATHQAMMEFQVVLAISS